MESEPLRYTFTKNNIIEENIEFLEQFITTDFREEYPLEVYSIEEEYIPFNAEPLQPESYIIRITRKDGGIIDSVMGNRMVYRKFENVKLFLGEIKETILLRFPGYSGVYLTKEE